MGASARALLARPLIPFSFASARGMPDGVVFSRGSTARYIDGAGVVRSAANGIPRVGHYISGVPTFLYEAASTNVCLQSEDFGTTWANQNTPTRTPAAHTASGVTLDLLGDNDAATLEGYSQDITFTGNAVKAVSVFMKQGTATTTAIRLFDTTAPAQRLLGVVTWSGGLPVITMTTGTSLGYETLADGVFRIRLVTTSVTAANTNTLFVFPACDASFTAALTGDVYVGGVQCENAATVSSYIPTTTAGVARSADSVTAWGRPIGPRSATLYERYYNFATSAHVEAAATADRTTVPTPTTGRAYTHFALANGTQTQARMAMLAGYYA